MTLRPQPQVLLEKHVPRDAGLVPSAVNDHFNALVAGLRPWPFTMYGDVGLGKTCAALCLLDWTGMGFRGGHYLTAREFADDLRRAENGNLTWYQSGAGGKVSVADMWKEIHQSVLVVVDEIGCRERANQTQYDSLLRVLDIRFGRPLVLVSNLTPDELTEVYDYRVVDRILAGTVLGMRGKSRRTNA
jgi:DNA replication protein DnaC